MLLIVFYIDILCGIFSVYFCFKASSKPLAILLLIIITEKHHDFWMMCYDFALKGLWCLIHCWLEAMLESFLTWSLVKMTLECGRPCEHHCLLLASMQCWTSSGFIFLMQGHRSRKGCRIQYLTQLVLHNLHLKIHVYVARSVVSVYTSRNFGHIHYYEWTLDE